MAYCTDHAIPHSVFLTEWSPEDRAKLMAYQLEKSERCTMCGTAGWEWEEDRFAYDPVTQVCEGCRRRDAYQEGQRDKAHGSSVVLLPKAQAATLREKEAELTRR